MVYESAQQKHSRKPTTVSLFAGLGLVFPLAANSSNLSKSSSERGRLYNSFTNHKPLPRIFSFGEDRPNQFCDGLHSLQMETVEIVFDSNSNLSSFSVE